MCENTGIIRAKPVQEVFNSNALHASSRSRDAGEASGETQGFYQSCRPEYSFLAKLVSEKSPAHHKLRKLFTSTRYAQVEFKKSGAFWFLNAQS
jgi:hypothetical protein